MRIPWTAALAAGLLLPAAAFASCPANVGTPVLSVAIKDPAVHYNFDLDSAALVRIAGENGMPRLKGEIPFGLTIGRYDLEVTINSDSVRDGGSYCTELRTAHVDIELKQLDVIVDRRFAPDSCQRRAVLDHEGQHVEVFREALRYYLPALERALAQTALPHGILVADRNAARAAYLGPITDALEPVFAALSSRAHDGNMQLDRPESYAAVFKRCGQW